MWHLCIKIRTELEIHLDYLSLQVFWIYPIYCISFVLNTVMYQEAQSLSFVMFTCRPLQVSLAPSQKHLAVQTQKLVLHFFLLALFHRTASTLCIESRFCVTSDMLEFALRADCGQCASIYAARSSPWHSSLRTHICALVLRCFKCAGA